MRRLSPSFAWFVGLLLVGGAPCWAGPTVEALDAAEALSRTQGPAAALPVFEALVEQLEVAGQAGLQARAMRHVGAMHWRLGNYDHAEEQLGEALSLARLAAVPREEARALNLLGLVSWDRGAYARARDHFGLASDMAVEIGDRRLAGAVANNLGLVADELGDYDESLARYNEALSWYEGTDFARGRGDTLGNMGGVNLLLGRYAEAQGFYERALVISEQLGSVVSLSQDHGNLALAMLGQGRQQEALSHLEQAMSFATTAGLPQDEAYWRVQRAEAMRRRGRYDRALEDLRAAVATYRRIESGAERVEALQEMAALHLALGDSPSAEREFREAMDLARDIGLSMGVTRNLLALSDLQSRRGEHDLALALARDAMGRAAEAGELALWCAALLRVSAEAARLGRGDVAREQADKALAVARQIGAPGLEAEALNRLGDQARTEGHHVEAVARYEQALGRLEGFREADLEWRVLHGKGRALGALDDVEAAIAAFEAAILVIEGVRERLAQERFRAGYIQDKYQVYVDLVALQIRSGRTADAFTTAERLRARTYLDLVDPAPPNLADDEDVSEFTLRERIRTLRQALRDETTGVVTGSRPAAVATYSRELRLAERDYQSFLDERRRRAGPGRTAKVPDYGRVAERLAHDEALVEFVVGDEAVMFFVLGHSGIEAGVVDLRRENLETKIELLRSLIERRDDQRWRKPAQSLSRALWTPLATRPVVASAKRIYIVPHGALNYLPFGLLPAAPTGDRLLVEDRVLAYLPTAAALVQPRFESTGRETLLAMAPARSRLKHAEDEARAVGALFGSAATALVGAAATETAFKASAKGYRLLHLATHGDFNRFNPLLSALELEADDANDGRLELHEVLSLKLSSDLVTLSACRTGLGAGHFAQVPAGDDFVGLTRAFLYAGSRSVLATLWEVDDAATLNLMKDFYEGLRPGIRDSDPAAALAGAQRRFLASPRHRHPYYWAPFVLVGHAPVPGRPGTT